MSKRAYTFAKASKAQMDEQCIITDSQKNGGLIVDVKDLAKAEDLEKKLVTVYYNCGSGTPNSTYDEVSSAFYQNKNAVRLMTFISDKKVLVFNAEAEEDMFVKFSGVYDGKIYEFEVTEGGWSVTNKELAGKSDVTEEATARSNADTALGARIDAIPDATYIVGLGMETAGSKKVADFWTAYNAGRECKFKYEGELYSISKVIGTTIYCEYIFFTWSKAFSINGVGEYFGEPTIEDYDFKLKDEEIEESIPSATSELTNDSGFIADAPIDSKQYARKNGAWEEVRGGGGASTWDEIEGKPSTFPPSSHTHTASDITDLSVPTKTSELDNDSGFVADAPSDGKQYARKDGEWSEVVIPSTDWSDIGNKPDTFTPSAHTHTKDEITDLVVPSKTSDLQNDSGFTKNFVATYEVTTFASIKSAVDAGNVVVCDMNNERHELLNSSSTKITFAKSYESSGNVNQMTIWVNSDNTWGSSVSTLAKKSDIPTVPTKTSDLTNDSDFTTKAYVDGLVGDVEILLADL